jgi:guanosine-3',5'-bis(diphosphate) 3'-pyrophosphohydrolase
MSIQRLFSKIETYYPKFDRSLVERAYLFAKSAHDGQFRNSGDAYILHPMEVACILAELELDVTTIIAGLLHDVVEDTGYTIEDIEAGFGPDAAFLVAGVTKLGKIEYKSKEDRHAENLRRMFLAMARDVRVILIKLADRLHNMRTLEHQPPDKQREIARETLEIYAPLAHRLGIYKIKWEIEDLSFRYLEPEKYYDLVERIAKKRREREDYTNLVITKLRDKLEEAEIMCEISGRPKNFYSIYSKMTNQGKELAEIYDLIAVRVIVSTVRECYATLGIVHTMWKPIPGRFKDYIAMPKQNMYQSLHTTLVGPLGEPFELQIRTYDMHRTAEVGIAAHWRYKEGNAASSDADFSEKLTWLRQILEWQNEPRDAKEFMESMKIDLFSDVVFVFTPKGDVVELPAGSVPIDFAYRIHTEVGNRCIGSKVNGKIVPIDYKLSNGDIVEVLTSKQNNGPSRDWLNIAQTSQAKNKIRAWYKKEKRDDNIVKGRDILDKELRRIGANPADFFKPESVERICRRYGYMSVDDLCAGIGNGTVGVSTVVSKLRDDINKKAATQRLIPEVDPKILAKLPEQPQRTTTGVLVKGERNLAVNLSHCCNPLPGDQIVGYITRGRGVSVHRADCPNIAYYFNGETERMVDVAWDVRTPNTYQVEIEVRALDRPQLTTDILDTVTETRTIVNAVHARAKKNKMALINLKLQICNLEHLYNVIQKVSRVSDVLEVHRVVP